MKEVKDRERADSYRRQELNAGIMGAAQEKVSADVAKCAECGATVRSGAKFCGQCGGKV